MQTSLQWLLQQIREVDNIIIINSEGGTRRYNAWGTHSYQKKSIHDTPADDMFLPAIKAFQAECYSIKKKHKFYRVYFPYCRKEDVIDLELGQTYELMSHIDSLFLRIHDKSKASPYGIAFVKNINRHEYTSSPEGQKLAQAIKDATQYFKDNPGWFDDVYKLKTPTHLETATPLPAMKSSSFLAAMNLNTDADLVDSGFEHTMPERLPCNVFYPPSPDIDDDSPQGAAERLLNRTERDLSSNNSASQYSVDDIDAFSINFIPPEDDDGSSSVGETSFYSEQRRYNTDNDWTMTVCTAAYNIHVHPH